MKFLTTTASAFLAVAALAGGVASSSVPVDSRVASDSSTIVDGVDLSWFPDPFLATKQRKTAFGFLDALNHADVDRILGYFSDSEDFSYQYLPPYLGEANIAPRNKTVMEQAFQATFDQLVSYMNVTNPPQKIIQDRDNIWMLVSDTGAQKNGTQYLDQYIFLFEFEKGGDKILHGIEYQDSAFCLAVFPGFFGGSS